MRASAKAQPRGEVVAFPRAVTTARQAVDIARELKIDVARELEIINADVHYIARVAPVGLAHLRRWVEGLADEFEREGRK